MLLGEVDTANDVESRGLERIGLEEILEKQSLQQAEKEEKERQLAKAFKAGHLFVQSIHQQSFLAVTYDVLGPRIYEALDKILEFW